MSPTPNQNPAQVSGNDEDAFLGFVKQTIQEEVARTAGSNPNPAAPVVPPSASPITVNVGGQAVTLNTQDELNAALQNTFGQYNAELARLREQAAAPAPTKEVTGQDEPQFNLNTFVE